MSDYSDLLRASAAALDMHELLKKPATVLLGVSAAAAAALEKVGIKTVFDLGTSNLFATARAVNEIGKTGTASAIYGMSTGDLLADSASFSSLQEIPRLPVSDLRMLSPAQSAGITAALEVESIRDLALWPPHAAARRLFGESVGGTQDPEELQTEELRPRTGQYPTERVYYNTLVMLKMLGEPGEQEELSGTVSLKSVITDQRGLNRPAVGAYLTFSQSWYAQGVTLGHLLHSLALAPGEATRIAVIDWSRRTRASVDEMVSESEDLRSKTKHARTLSEITEATATDMETGGSHSQSAAESSSESQQAAAGTGFLPSLYVSADGSVGHQAASSRASADSSGWSLGTKSVNGSMTQNVNDRTTQHSTSARNRRASAVREVSQSEHEQVSTRIVANYNHMHALTVQYYEVVQVYRVATQLHRADRCLFVPMELLDFSGPEAMPYVERFRPALIRAALNGRIRSLLLDDATAVEIAPVAPIRFMALATNPRLMSIASLASVAAAPSVPATLAASASQATPSAPATLASQAAPLVARVWDRSAIALASRVLDRSLVRENSNSLHVPDDTELVALSFDSINVRGVRLQHAGGGGSGDKSFTLPADNPYIDLPRGIRMIEMDAIHASKAEEAPKDGTMTLHCSYMGRRFDLPGIPISLGQGTGKQKVAAFTNDQADRRKELLQHLQGQRDYYSRAVFRSLDSATLTLMLSRYKWNGKPLIDQVEPQPVKVVGNYLILRAPVEDEDDAGISSGENRVPWGQLLKDRNLILGQQPDERIIPVATGGVFAEAVLGRSNSAEKLDITRFWHWQDSPIPLTPTDIAPVGTGSRATAEDLKPGQLSSPVLNIVNPTALPGPAGLGAAFGALGNVNFRDMSGLAGTQALVNAGMAGTLDAATAAGQITSANLATEAQKSVAMAQVLADIAKAAMGMPPSGGSVQGISAQGAKLNQGQKIDGKAAAASGTTGGGSGAAGGSAGTSPSGGGGGATTSGGSPSGDAAAGGGTTGGNEQAAFQSALWGGAGASGAEMVKSVKSSLLNDPNLIASNNPNFVPAAPALDAGNFQKFVDAKKLDLEIADLLRALDSYPADSWAKQTATFAYHELDVGNLFGIFSSANVSKLKALIPQSLYATADSDASRIVGNVDGANTRYNIGGPGAYKGYTLISDSIVSKGAGAGADRQFFAAVLTHELTHFRNRDFFIALRNAPVSTNPTFYIDIAKANLHPNTQESPWYIMGEIVSDHVAWRVQQDLQHKATGAPIPANPNTKGFFRFALVALDGAGWKWEKDSSGQKKDSAYLADLKAANKYNEQIALWLQKIGAEKALYHDDPTKNTAVRKFFQDTYDAVKPAFAMPVEAADGGG